MVIFDICSLRFVFVSAEFGYLIWAVGQRCGERFSRSLFFWVGVWFGGL